MNYTFKIIDTQRNDLTTTVERVKGSSVILEWKGSDSKDELFIVGSSLSFTMVGMSMADGQYLDLLTGNESRYRLIMEDENGVILWQGFMLPDSYAEPYSNAPILVDFKATDGLGRLKGKYLPDDFYKEEKSVIEIIAACLKLTGLDLSFRFSPAIENSQIKDYNQIYLDTSLFHKQDAHKILNDLLESMCCTLYQADNFYNIEGFNVRNMRVYDAQVYAPDGTLTDTVEITRLKKEVTGLYTPEVSVNPPYGVINISHKQEELTLPEGLSKEENDGWTVNGKIEKIGVDGSEQEIESTDKIHATEWWGNNGFYAYAGPEDNAQVYFGVSEADNTFINLRTKPYVEKGKKYELKIDFEVIPTPETLTSSDIDTIIKDGKWENPFEFYVLADSDEIQDDPLGFKSVMFTNLGTGSNSLDISFDSSKKSENTIQFVAKYNGLLDIRIGGVKTLNGEYYGRFIKAVKITEASLANLDHKEAITTELLKEGYTLKKEVKLTYGDDPYGISSAFRLKKLNEPDQSDVIAIPIKRPFTFQGVHYAEVDLSGANLIAENKDASLALSRIVDEVIYNYNGTQDHVIKLKEFFDENNFTVSLNNYNKVTEKRNYWREWTDSYYNVERKRYPEIVANIYSRLFDKPTYQMLDFQVLNNIKFNDFIGFTFKDNQDWILTNCSWDIDKGVSTIATSQNYYALQEGNIAPIVEAGEDKEFTDTGQLTCEAFDPDGYIASYQWTVLSGAEEVIINDPYSQNTSFSLTNPTQSFYEFEITVTDNEGATATDRVIFYRATDVQIELEQIYDSEVDGRVLNPYHERHFKVNFLPEIPEGMALRLEGVLTAEWWASGPSAGNICYASIEHDGVEKGMADATAVSNPEGDKYVQEKNVSINVIKGDEVIVKLSVYKLDEKYYDGTGSAQIEVSGATYSTGAGTITGPPITERIDVQFYLELF